MKVKSESEVAQSYPTLPSWTAAYQAPLSMGFSRQEYWSGVPSPSPFATYSMPKISPGFSFAITFNILLGHHFVEVRLVLNKLLCNPNIPTL